VTPKQAGARAFYKGIRFTECPYPYPKERIAWQEAYRGAEKKERELMIKWVR
jgi:hypothetical protein